jgi:hypothetical protein
VFSQAPFPATAYLARVFYATGSNGTREVHVTGRGKLRQVIDSVKWESSACNGMLLSGELDYVTIIPLSPARRRAVCPFNAVNAVTDLPKSSKI